MGSRVAGSGPVYEPLWFVKFNGVKASSTIKIGDIVTADKNTSEKITRDNDPLAIRGYAQALENKEGGTTNGATEIQLAISGSAIRMPIKTPNLKSGQKVKLDVTEVSGVYKQTFELATAADIAAGRVVATFLHLEASQLSEDVALDDLGVFRLE